MIVKINMFLIFHVTSCELMFKGLCEFWGGSSLQSHYLPMLGDHQSGASGDMKYEICRVSSQNHVIEESCNYLSGCSSWYITTLPSLVAIGIVVVEIYCFWFVTQSSKAM